MASITRGTPWIAAQMPGPTCALREASELLRSMRALAVMVASRGPAAHGEGGAPAEACTTAASSQASCAQVAGSSMRRCHCRATFPTNSGPLRLSLRYAMIVRVRPSQPTRRPPSYAPTACAQRSTAGRVSSGAPSVRSSPSPISSASSRQNVPNGTSTVRVLPWLPAMKLRGQWLWAPT
jgi:hypothetical protein